ncbi:MAG: hypothetical protein DMD82_00005, partial [Candidatus Rokuibacteriota bacterium]
MDKDGGDCRVCRCVGPARIHDPFPLDRPLAMCFHNVRLRVPAPLSLRKELPMKRSTLLIATLIAALGAAMGIGAKARAELPPLIDRALIYGDPEISTAQLSPDGHYMSFIKPYKDA